MWIFGKILEKYRDCCIRIVSQFNISVVDDAVKSWKIQQTLRLEEIKVILLHFSSNEMCLLPIAIANLGLEGIPLIISPHGS